MTEESYRKVLRLPQIPELLLGACLARLAGRMFTMAIILYTLNRFGSPVLTGWVSFAAIGPGLIASPSAGALLDRLQGPLAIILDMLVSAGLLFILVGIDRSGLIGAPLLLMLVAAYSLTSPLSGAGIRVLIPRLVPDEALERANALDTGSYALIEVIGPALAGVLFGFAGPKPTILTIAALYLLAIVSLLPVLRANRAPPPRSTNTLIADAAAGLAYVARHSSLRGLAVSYSLYQTTWGVMLVAVPVAAMQELGAGASADLTVGFLWATAGLAGGAGALIAGRVGAIGREREVIGIGVLATALAIYPLSACLGLYGLTVGIAIAGFLEGPVDVGVLTLRQRRTEPQWLGRVLTVSMSLNLSGLPLGSAVGGWLVTQSLTAAFIFGALASISSAVRIFVLMPSAAQFASAHK